MGMVRLAVGQQHLPDGDIQGDEERSGTVPYIAWGHSLHISQTLGQDRLGAVQGLGLAFFVHTKDQGLMGRIQVKPHNFSDLLHEKRVTGEFEVFLPMELEAEGPRNLEHRGLGELGLGG